MFHHFFFLFFFQRKKDTLSLSQFVTDQLAKTVCRYCFTNAQFETEQRGSSDILPTMLVLLFKVCCVAFCFVLFAHRQLWMCSSTAIILARWVCDRKKRVFGTSENLYHCQIWSLRGRAAWFSFYDHFGQHITQTSVWLVSSERDLDLNTRISTSMA